MPEFKKKPKMGRPKAKPPSAMHPKQAARMMKEKYLQQLDQRQEGTDGETSYAIDQVEGAGRWATDEVVIHTPRPRQHRKNAPKERPRSERKSDPAEGRATQEPKQQPKHDAANAPKQRERPRQQATNAPKERTTLAVKERTTQGKAPAAHHPGQRPTYSPEPHTSTKPAPQAASPKAMPRQAAPVAESHRAAGGQLPSRPPRQEPITKPSELSMSSSVRGSPAPGSGKAPRPQGSTKSAGAFRERTCTIFKTRSGPTAKPSTPAMKVKPPTARAAKKAARQTVQRQTTQRMVAQAQRTAKATMTATKKVAEAVVRAVAHLVSGLVGLLGGGVLVVILLLVAVIAAIISSPFGIFFAGGSSGGGSAPATVSVVEAVAQVSREYNAKLEELQAGDYDSIELAGAAANWPDVLAVFASRYAAAEDGVDVATLDADRVGKLASTFWDMTDLTSTVETIDHPDSDPDDDTDDSWTERILHLTITAKTAEDMKTAYGFTAYQISALDELLMDRAALSSLAGSVSITNIDALVVLDDLPSDLSPERQAVVKTALTLYGKVTYFWGGKSLTIGWDSRWGRLQKVTAEGSSTTGTYRPYGLDCSGFVDWVFYNATGGSYIIGHAGGAHAQHTYCSAISWDNAIPGDLVFYPEDEHVGIVCGRDESGSLLVIHCASSANNVVITSASGFTSVARPVYYGE